MIKNLSSWRATLELILATAFWGFGFVATIWGLKFFTVYEFLLVRFFLSWIFGIGIEFLFYRSIELSLRVAVPAGILLALTLLFQTIGLESTTASKSGFITTLYVVFVPLFQILFISEKEPKIIFLFALFSIFGAFLLSEINFFSSTFDINKGDLWTLACAIMAALHIVFIGWVQKSGNIKTLRALSFNNSQSLTSTVIIAAILVFQKKSFLPPLEALTWDQLQLPIIGLLMTVFGSTLIGFTIQVHAQKVLSPSVASMIFLLESPFALLFGILFLAESLSALQLIGAGIILLSATATLLWPRS